MRVKHQVIALRAKGANIRFILGIDLGGTSREVLTEVLEWGVDVRVVKHRIARHTFHPKLFLFRWADRATIFVGSNNMTEGGFFGNYECAIRITYHFPEENEIFKSAEASLKRLLDPEGPVVYKLTPDFLDKLIDGGEIPSESEARTGRDVPARATKGDYVEGAAIFGAEDIAAPPPLPSELLEGLVTIVRARRRAARIEKRRALEDTTVESLPIDDQRSDYLLPAAFYMTLPTLQGHSIPGESRIPLEAIEMAKEFWGWPDKYSRAVSPRAGRDRVYWNWRPKWRVWSVDSPTDVIIQEVRMYMYENSSDFRFYARPLINAGADLGDIVRIKRIAEPEGDAEYECVLAKTSTQQYREWIELCVLPVRNSQRLFGYA